jgi:glycosyltransferase involved in cell wall biosynthesis
VGQSYKNIEIVLVDDGATDSSGKKCDEWAKKDERIGVIHKKNGGLNYARRDGVKESVGEWICFIDSDDIVHEDYVRDLLLAAMKANVDIAVARNQKFMNENEVMSDHSTGEIEVVKNKKQLMRQVFVESPDPGVFMIITCGKIFRKNVIASIDWDLSNARANEDELEAIQYYNLQNNGVVILKKVLYYYRDNPNSIMNKPYTNIYEGKNLSRFEWIEVLYKVSKKYFGKGKYVDELLYHNVMLNLLFLNRDLTRGTFTDDDAKVFTQNFYPKIKDYQKIEQKYKLSHEEARAYSVIKNGGLFAYWTDDKRLCSRITGMEQENGRLKQEVRYLKSSYNSLRSSKTYKLGAAMTGPYRKIRGVLSRPKK